MYNPTHISQKKDLYKDNALKAVFWFLVWGRGELLFLILQSWSIHHGVNII